VEAVMGDSYAGVPTSPKNFTIRPLTKGIIRDAPSTLINDGAARDILNADVSSNGLERRAGYTFAYRTSATVPYQVPFRFGDEKLMEVLGYWTSTGAKQLLVLTNRLLYLYSSSEFVPVKWVQDYTITTLVDEVITDSTASRDFVDDNVVAGMYVQLTTTGGDVEVYAISAVTATTISLTSIPSGTYESTFQVLRVFGAEDTFKVDFVYTATRIYFADGTLLGIPYYDGEVLRKLEIADSSSNETLLGCRAISFIGERLFFAYATEADGTAQRNRIWWSTALNDARVESTQYLDLEGISGEVLRLKSLGKFLLAYSTDGISYGRSSNLTGLPYIFSKIETGGIGLVGMRALSGYLNSHFFVGQDNIYTVTNELQVVKIGSPILRETVLAVASQAKTLAVIDTKTQSVVFEFAINSESELDTAYRYYYETQAWSRTNKLWAAISQVGAITVAALGDYPSTAWPDLGSRTYQSFGGGVSEIQTFYGDFNGFLYLMSPSVSRDEILETSPSGYTIGSAVMAFLFETKDFDSGDPDLIKSALRLGVRIYDLEDRTSDISIVVTGSTNKGRDWKALGTIRIRPTDDEGAVNFRLTGSLLRFRLETASAVPRWRLEEITLRGRGRGVEMQLGDVHGT
jgi:hypothetical protein